MSRATSLDQTNKNVMKSLSNIHKEIFQDGQEPSENLAAAMIFAIQTQDVQIQKSKITQDLLRVFTEKIRGTKYEELVFPKPLSPEEQEFERKLDKTLGAT